MKNFLLIVCGIAAAFVLASMFSPTSPPVKPQASSTTFHVGETVFANYATVACPSQDDLDKWYSLGEIDGDKAAATKLAERSCFAVQLGAGGEIKQTGHYANACVRFKGQPDCAWLKQKALVAFEKP